MTEQQKELVNRLIELTDWNEISWGKNPMYKSDTRNHTRYDCNQDVTPGKFISIALHHTNATSLLRLVVYAKNCYWSPIICIQVGLLGDEADYSLMQKLFAAAAGDLRVEETPKNQDTEEELISEILTQLK